MDDRSANAVRELDDYSVAESLATPDGAEPLFVINLCAAMTPQSLDDIGIAGIERYKLYQVSRMEDGRRRYRLRLGFFTTEAAAEDVLVTVRSQFATAFTACLCDEDLKYASGYLKRSVQDLARTGRFKIPLINKPVVPVTVTPSPMVAAVTAPIVASPVAVPAPSTPTVAKQAPKIAVSKPVEIKLDVKVAASRPVDIKPVDIKPVVSKVASNPLSNPLEDTSAGAIEITWVPDQLDAAPAAPITSSVPRATAASVQPAIIGNPKAAARDIADKIAAGAKTAPTPPPSINVAAAKNAANALTLEKAPAAPPAKSVMPTSAAFHVGKGVTVPDVGLSLASESSVAVNKSVAASKAASAKPLPAPAAIVKTTVKTAAPAAAPTTAATLSRPQSTWRNGGDEVPTLDTTQTIRDLTQGELNDANGLKWFVVQLALSDQPVNLDTMPRLDIFEAYSLYSVALLENNGIRHALRLGFFTEEVSAEAVLGYLKTFFSAPQVERISRAEYQRFSQDPAVKTTEVAAVSNARVITLEEKRSAPPTTLSALKSAQRISVTPVPAPKPTKVSKPVTNSVSNSVPTIHEAVATSRIVPTTTTMYRTSGKYAAPAVRRSGATGVNTPLKRNVGNSKGQADNQQHDLLEEARLMGLSDTQILRVQKNPSLLSRLVGKLTK